MYVNEGAVVESCISQALVSNGYRIHFYSKPNSSLKMDFVISYKGHLTALETRSGKTKISRSLLMLTSGDYKVERGDQDRRRPCGCGWTRDTPSAAFRTLLLRHPPHRDGPLQDPEEVNEAIRRMCPVPFHGCRHKARSAVTSDIDGLYIQ